MSVIVWVGLLTAPLIALLAWPLRQVIQIIITTVLADRFRHLLPDKSPEDFNRRGARAGAPNCLSFALGLTEIGWVPPGYLSYIEKRQPSALRGGSGWADWLALVRVDGLRPLRSAKQLHHGYPVAVYMGFGPDRDLGTRRRRKDYHFSRPDRLGGWWDKPGQQPARRRPYPPLILGRYVLVGVYVTDHGSPHPSTTALPWYTRRRLARVNAATT